MKRILGLMLLGSLNIESSDSLPDVDLVIKPELGVQITVVKIKRRFIK